MTALQFGKGAYLRSYAGSPEIQLLNRFMEAVPSNAREGVGLIARQGTTYRATIGVGPIRKTYSKLGLFNGDLFAVSKNTLYRYSAAGVVTPIAGVIGSGNPKFTWDSGPGYQHLFVSDGELLQVYKGGTLAVGKIASTHATGSLTGSTPTNQVINIGGTYYSWNAAVDTGAPDGTSAHPWLAKPTSGGDPWTAMARLLMFVGVPGTDFSTALTGPSLAVTAVANGGPPATSLTLTAINEGVLGNAIATTILSGAGIAWGAVTLVGAVLPTNQVLCIGGVYYSWNASVNANAPDGSAAHPWLANPTSGGDPWTAMANLLDFIGVPGTDFSTALGTANTQVTALANGGPPATSLSLTSILDNTSGNAIVTTVAGTAGLVWGAATLIGGGIQTLLGVYVPTGEPINGLCTLDHYIMASVGKANKMFFILPGAIVIQTLNFFAKESSPDPIMDLCTVGDMFLAAGSGSIETWYATGSLNAPFAPIQGRTVARGIVDGTLVNVHDSAFFVGSDGVVYTYGVAGYAQGGAGFQRVSDNGIEERIRLLTRAQAGVP